MLAIRESFTPLTYAPMIGRPIEDSDDLRELVIDFGDYLLINDKRGRKITKINQIKTVGSLGILLQAKRAGLIPCVAPLIAQIASSPVFMGSVLIHTVLELAGEN